MRKCTLILALFLSISMIVISISNALKREIQIFAVTVGNTTLSSQLHSVMQKELQNNVEPFVTIQHDETERIASIQVHVSTMNLFAESVTIELYNHISEYEGQKFGVPLGNLFNFALLSGKGPLIPVRPIVLGGIASEIKSEFISAGINQTLHRISLTYSIALRYLAPFNEVYDTITLSLVLSETLIVGDVPIYKD